MTFHVKNEETTIKGYRSRLLRAQMYTGNGFYFAKWHWCYFFRGGGGGILEDDSTQRLRGKPYNKVAIFLHRFILLV